MRNTDETGGPGAGRVEDHPLLGPLPSAAQVGFAFDEVRVEGRAGEPIAAALLAAGIRAFRTMPGRGDPRGGYCMVGRCADCFLIVDGVSNIKACIEAVRDGMRVQTQYGLDELAMESLPVTSGETAE